MRLIKIISFQGTIQCVTGISVRGAGGDLGIGGADDEVIKNPLTGEPYIPGSSLKGKMRSQLERKYGKINMVSKRGKMVGEPCNCGRKDCPICTLFGAHKKPGAYSAPTRILVRDCEMTDAFRAQVEQLPPERGSYLEVKSENIIDRQTGASDSPRFVERVPAGASFSLNILLQIMEGDDEQRLVDMIKEGLALVEDSYLGSSGSRGYGQVRFDYTVEEKAV